MMTDLIRSLKNLGSKHQNLYVTLGNFDGMHRGHLALIEALRLKAGSSKTLVILFEPQPLEFLSPQKAPPRLQRWSEKFQMLRVDYVLLLKFDEKLSTLSANEFIEKILIKQLAIQGIVVGHDFRFGYQRQGTVELLKTYALRHQFSIDILSPVTESAHRVSSTDIRMLLAEGHFKQAAALLGRPYCLAGRIEHGAKRGRTIGLPTANINLRRLFVALKGVFAVYASFDNQTWLPGVANIGNRPTVDGKNTLLEVHLLDFNCDCYGQKLSVKFVKKIRHEKKFADLDALKVQIQQDIITAKKILNLTEHQNQRCLN